MSLPRSLPVIACAAVLLQGPPRHARGAEAPPSLAEAVDRAKAAHRTLVVEFSTAWCGPCQTLAREVLPHPRVKAALAKVTFVQYDAEKEPGRSAAAELRVGGFPTVVALDSEGRTVERVVGLLPPEELSAWLRSVAEKGKPRLPTLLADAKLRPREPSLSLAIAKQYIDAGDHASARRWLTATEKLDRRGADGEEASFARMRLDIVDEEHQARARIARDYLQRFPGGAHAAEAAEIYSLASPPRADAERVLGLVLNAVLDGEQAAAGSASLAEKAPARGMVIEAPGATSRFAALSPVVLAALRSAALDAALRGAAALEVGSDPASLALAAEVHHQRGDDDRARALARTAMELSQPRDHARYEAMLLRFRLGDRDPGDSLRVTDPLAPPSPRRVADTADEALQRRTATFRRLVTRVARSCRTFATAAGVQRTWVRVRLGDHGIAGVTLLEPSVPVMLEGCIAGELVGLPFSHPIENEDTFAIQY